RFLLGLAVLGLLSEVAGDRALMCLVDDVHWLDRASAQVLGFTARRLAADPVGLVFAAREPGEELAGLAELEVGGLRDDDARALVWRAAGRLGIPIQAAVPAADSGLVEFGARVRFRHPLARSAAYRLAPIEARQEIHTALAEVTDPAADSDRRAWHRAQAAPG